MQWLRLYDSVVEDPKVQRLAPPLFKVWINLLCIANRSEPRGLLPSTDDLSFILRMSKPKITKALTELGDAGLIDRVDQETLAMHNWNTRQRASDDIAKRVRKHREDQDGNVTSNVTDNISETPPDTDTEQNRADTESDTEAAPAPRATTDPLGFVEFFWSRYPKKEDRKLAVDQWKRLRPDAALMEQIADAIEHQKQGRKWHEGFIKAPHRWLRDKNWLDEVEPIRSVNDHVSKEDRRQAALDYFHRKAGLPT